MQNRHQLRLVAIYDIDAAKAAACRGNYLARMEAAGAKVDWEVALAETPEALLEMVDAADVCTP